MPPKPFLVFVATNMPSPLFQSKTHVLGGSMPFRSRTWHVAKTGIEGHLMHECMPPEPFLVFFSKHAQSTTLDLKLKFWMVSRHFVATPHPLRKLVSGCIKSMSLCLRNHFLFGRNEHAQSTALGLKLMFTILLDTSMHCYIAFDDS